MQLINPLCSCSCQRTLQDVIIWLHFCVRFAAFLAQVVASSAGLPVKPGSSLHATVITPDGANMFIAIFDNLPGGSSCKRSIAKILAAAAFPTFKQIVAAGSLPGSGHVKTHTGSSTNGSTVQSQLHQTLLNLDRKLLGPDFNLPLEVGQILHHLVAHVCQDSFFKIQEYCSAGSNVDIIFCQACLGGDTGSIVVKSCGPQTGVLYTATDNDCSSFHTLDELSL